MKEISEPFSIKRAKSSSFLQQHTFSYHNIHDQGGLAQCSGHAESRDASCSFTSTNDLLSFLAETIVNFCARSSLSLCLYCRFLLGLQSSTTTQVLRGTRGCRDITSSSLPCAKVVYSQYYRLRCFCCYLILFYVMFYVFSKLTRTS